MGYTTDFNGKFTLDKPLKPEHAAYLRQFSETRRMKRHSQKCAHKEDPVRMAAGLGLGEFGEYYVGTTADFGQKDDGTILEYNSPPPGQPGLWCQWEPTKDGKGIEWNGAEKFYNYSEWLLYICDHFLGPWGYKLNGQVSWQGEETSDFGILECVDNEVTAHLGLMTLPDPKSLKLPTLVEKTNKKNVTKKIVVADVEIPEELLQKYASDDGQYKVGHGMAIADLVLKVWKGK